MPVGRQVAAGENALRAPADERPRPRTAPDPAVLAAPVEARTKRANEALRSRGIETAADLLETPPRTYRDYGSEVQAIAELLPGEEATVRARVESVRDRPTRRRNLRIVEAQVRDDS